MDHDALKRAARSVCEALGVGDSSTGGSIQSRLAALYGQVHGRLRQALHTGVKRALAVVSSHYAGLDLEAISDGYVVDDDDEKARVEVAELAMAVEAPGTALATLFEEEVAPAKDVPHHP